MKAMKPAALAAVVFLGLVSSATARDDSEGGRWVTFRVTHTIEGETDLQLDRNSVHQEGPYRTFWTRKWFADAHSVLTIPSGFEGLAVYSEKYAVDCISRKISVQFLDSNAKRASRTRIPLARVNWRGLEKSPAVLQVVCGNRPAR